MKNTLLPTVVILLAALQTNAIGAPGMEEWPELTNYQSVSGRVATENDIKIGAAVFLLESEGQPIGRPMDIEIPQYAFHNDDETNQVSKVVVIQAEEATTNG